MASFIGRYWRGIALLICVSQITSGVALAQGGSYVRPRNVDNLSVPGCGSLANAFGPYDYRDPQARGQPLSLVERAHFTPTIESLQIDRTLGSRTEGSIVGNIDYTLRAFPNHHRALNAIARWETRGSKPSSDPKKRADCYFKRAVAFTPDDAVVHMLYGNFLAGTGAREEARTRYEEALRLDPESAETHYNFGLLLVDSGKFIEATQHANEAYSRGYPLPGLRDKLKKAGAY